jgi:peptidoglycan/xylan/chitin deacetylase (PgdA/CDA1 family)
MELFRHSVMYLPRRLWLLRVNKQTANVKTRGRKVIVILSSDTEFDPPSEGGTWGKRSSKMLLDGLPRFLDVCDDFQISATLFCEGKLVDDLPDLFRELAKRHEIGCHSFFHEWLGIRPPGVWIPRRGELAVLRNDQKMMVVEQAMDYILRVTGKKPVSFKAPFNSIDHPSTLLLLEKAGFETDSSLPCYDNRSFTHPFRPAPPRHVSARHLWSEGTMRLIEVPFMIRPHPFLLHPFDETLALKSTDIHCRIDYLSGRQFSLVHITSHPWEFSDIKPWGRGKANAEYLTRYLSQLVDFYDVEFLTVGEFARKWENEHCPTHSRQETLGP